MALLDACENGTLLDRSQEKSILHISSLLLSTPFLKIFHLFVFHTLFIEPEFSCNKKASRLISTYISRNRFFPRNDEEGTVIFGSPKLAPWWRFWLSRSYELDRFFPSYDRYGSMVRGSRARLKVERGELERKLHVSQQCAPWISEALT